MDHLTGKMIAPKPAPARIVIEQGPNAEFKLTHNLQPLYLIGVLSMIINQVAGQLATQDAMIIDPNKPKTVIPPAISDPDNGKAS